LDLVATDVNVSCWDDFDEVLEHRISVFESEMVKIDPICEKKRQHSTLLTFDLGLRDSIKRRDEARILLSKRQPDYSMRDVVLFLLKCQKVVHVKVVSLETLSRSKVEVASYL